MVAKRKPAITGLHSQGIADDIFRAAEKAVVKAINKSIMKKPKKTIPKPKTVFPPKPKPPEKPYRHPNAPVIRPAHPKKPVREKTLQEEIYGDIRVKKRVKPTDRHFEPYEAPKHPKPVGRKQTVHPHPSKIKKLR